MERFVVREPRNSSVFSATTTDNQGVISGQRQSIIPNAAYYKEEFRTEYPTMRRNVDLNGGYMSMAQANTLSFPHAGMNTIHQPQGQTGQYISGIDPNYLAAYSANNCSYISAGAPGNQSVINSMPMTTVLMNPPLGSAQFGKNFENRELAGPERIHNLPSRSIAAKTSTAPMAFTATKSQKERIMKNQSDAISGLSICNSKNKEIDDLKKNNDIALVPSRADKLKALYKSGSRAFSGPVEKVLKWHKALQDIGLLVIYEIVAKCVSVRTGESFAKHLVIRDDNGPAMQVVYYEIDFLLPEIKPPCTVRVVGKMMTGSSRFQAYNIRPATGDDVAIQPRRAAVANHHVAKLCKEYAVNSQI